MSMNDELNALDSAITRALAEIDRLRSENVELRAALESIANSARYCFTQTPADDVITRILAKANTILERTKK